MNPFRISHLISLLELYDQEGGALDFFVSCYFRHHKSLGSKDRAYISDTVYQMYRWLSLIDFLLTREQIQPSWKERVELLSAISLDSYQNDTSIPVHIRSGFPKELFDSIVDSYGIEEGRRICLVLNERAPTSIRVNTLKTTKEALLKYFENEGCKVSVAQYSPVGIIFQQKINFFNLPAFKEGHFEVQDESSQCAALLADARPGDEVLDYCSGSGGKALAIAPKLHGKGQIHLHDIRKGALIEAKKRLKRAGIQNAQIIHSSEDKRLKLLEGRMNWVFVDAPCSGTGTLRRNPDMKWKFSKQMVENLVQEQRQIFQNALRFVVKRGKIVFATCSILKEENEEQVAYFEREYGVELVEPIFKMVPAIGGPDGFFAAVFKLKDR